MKWHRRITSNLNAWVSELFVRKSGINDPVSIYHVQMWNSLFSFFKRSRVIILRGATRSNFCVNRKIWLCNLLPDSCCCVRHSTHHWIFSTMDKIQMTRCGRIKKRRCCRRASFDERRNFLRCAKWNTKKSVFSASTPRVSHRLLLLLSFHFFSLFSYSPPKASSFT